MNPEYQATLDQVGTGSLENIMFRELFTALCQSCCHFILSGVNVTGSPATLSAQCHKCLNQDLKETSMAWESKLGGTRCLFTFICSGICSHISKYILRTVVLTYFYENKKSSTTATFAHLCCYSVILGLFIQYYNTVHTANFKIRPKNYKNM